MATLQHHCFIIMSNSLSQMWQKLHKMGRKINEIKYYDWYPITLFLLLIIISAPAGSDSTKLYLRCDFKTSFLNLVLQSRETFRSKKLRVTHRTWKWVQKIVFPPPPPPLWEMIFSTFAYGGGGEI